MRTIKEDIVYIATINKIKFIVKPRMVARGSEMWDGCTDETILVNFSILNDGNCQPLCDLCSTSSVKENWGNPENNICIMDAKLFDKVFTPKDGQEFYVNDGKLFEEVESINI